MPLLWLQRKTGLMKTLTLRNIPEDVQKIINKNKWFGQPATKAIYRVIRQVGDLQKEINKLQNLLNKSTN